MGIDFRGDGSFLRGERCKRNFTLGELATISVHHSFYLFYFFFADSVLHVEMLRGIVQGEYLPD